MSLTDEVTKRHIHTTDALIHNLRNLSRTVRDGLKSQSPSSSEKVLHASARLEEAIMWLELHAKDLKGE